MKWFEDNGRRLVRVVLALALLAPAACDIFNEGAPSSARVVIEGGSGETFYLATSNNFTVVLTEDGESRDLILNDADTIQVSAPFNQRFSLGPAVRFYLQAFREPGLAEPINIRILIDGEQRFNSTSTLEDLTLEFVYTYR